MSLGETINQFFEEISMTNYGNEFLVIYGRDIGWFIIGYLTHLTISLLIFMLAEKRRGKNF